ncbi:hypothetical protein KIV56_12880 [Cryobacterium breve]|uniref:Uncharacterized protein n=1 Tax=Cryobacterium breve TaxID=1259258 RepID=A0ABY7NH50_9MICO|nr:hypothetical protein [Cryobacterium breve]WBM81640.1 hypothetical protein KIV56_12880 [Cryobacterium breve]
MKFARVYAKPSAWTLPVSVATIGAPKCRALRRYASNLRRIDSLRAASGWMMLS